MFAGPPNADSELSRWRQYLLLLARLQLGPPRQGKPDASDVVQQTMIDAVRQRGHFRGTSELEWAAWLRRILACNLADAFRTLHRQKRDADRLQSIESALDRSSASLGSFLAASLSSPSIRAGRIEQLAAVATALERLPDAQREVLVLHYLESWPLDRISGHLNRSPTAVAGLLKRGLKQLRTLLTPTGSEGS